MSAAIERESGSTFSIANDLIELFEDYDHETGEIPEDFDERLNALAMRMDDKIDGCAGYLRQLAAAEETLKAEAERLRARARKFANRQRSIKDGMAYLLTVAEQRKVETVYTNVWIQKNTPALVIEDESRVPAQYVETEVVTRINKSAIKADIKAGKEVEGCALVQSEGIRIK